MRAVKEKLEIVSDAAHFDLVRFSSFDSAQDKSPQVAQYKPPPFLIFAGLRLAEVASATQTEELPRPELIEGQNAPALSKVEGFGLIQEYCTK